MEELMDKKETATLNVNIDTELFDILGKVSSLTGKTKSSLVEDAIINIISPYCVYDYSSDCKTIKRSIEATPGLYQNDDQSTFVECKILGHITMMGQPYVKIYKDGQLMSVPEDKVRNI
jgi:hypothetical protein